MRNSFAPEKFYVVGNNLALDFINSEPLELTPQNLLSWAIAVKLVGSEEAEKLLSKWNDTPLDDVVAFRGKMREIVGELADGKKIKKNEVDLLNSVLRQTRGFAELAETPDGFIKLIVIDLTEPNKILVPIAEAMADLLCYGELSFLRKCERDDCILYFYDTTKNHKRRWCSMAICGNRAKAAKFYQKKKARS